MRVCCLKPNSGGGPRAAAQKGGSLSGRGRPRPLTEGEKGGARPVWATRSKRKFIGPPWGKAADVCGCCSCKDVPGGTPGAAFQGQQPRALPGLRVSSLIFTFLCLLLPLGGAVVPFGARPKRTAGGPKAPRHWATSHAACCPVFAREGAAGRQRMGQGGAPQRSQPQPLPLRYHRFVD